MKNHPYEEDEREDRERKGRQAVEYLLVAFADVEFLLGAVFGRLNGERRHLEREKYRVRKRSEGAELKVMVVIRKEHRGEK